MIVLVVLAGPAAAQKLYRCGNQYQDRPCASTKRQAPEENSTAAATAPSAREVRREERMKQIRCENFGRQRDELREKQRASNKQIAESLGAQLKALEERMRTDGC